MTTVPLDLDKLRRALTFFRVMAFVVVIGLLVLVVEMILSYGFGMKGHDNPLYWWPQPHGFLFIVYVAAVANLGFRSRWPLPKMVGVMLAGCVPFLSFWVEHVISRRERALLSGTSPQPRADVAR